MLKSLDAYLVLAEQAHGHLCAGQILGVRLAMHGLQLLGIHDPVGADRKRLITFVEIDRCATDAITVVTGCRLGKRALKFRDFGKLAATFCDLASSAAVRVVALESARERAAELFPQAASKNEQQMLAYRQLPDDELFSHRRVRVSIPPEELPGFKGRIECEECGEGINFRKQVERAGRVLCRACAGERYWEPLPD